MSTVVEMSLLEEMSDCISIENERFEIPATVVWKEEEPSGKGSSYFVKLADPLGNSRIMRVDRFEFDRYGPGEMHMVPATLFMTGNTAYSDSHTSQRGH